MAQSRVPHQSAGGASTPTAQRTRWNWLPCMPFKPQCHFWVLSVEEVVSQVSPVGFSGFLPSRAAFPTGGGFCLLTQFPEQKAGLLGWQTLRTLAVPPGPGRLPSCFLGHCSQPSAGKSRVLLLSWAGSIGYYE